MTRQTLCGSILGDTKVAAPPENRSTGFSCGRFFLACSKTKNFCRLRRQTALRVPRDTKTQRRTSDPQRDQPQLQTTQPHPDNQERSINYTAEQILLTTRPPKRGRSSLDRQAPSLTVRASASDSHFPLRPQTLASAYQGVYVRTAGCAEVRCASASTGQPGTVGVVCAHCMFPGTPSSLPNRSPRLG